MRFFEQPGFLRAICGLALWLSCLSAASASDVFGREGPLRVGDGQRIEPLVVVSPGYVTSLSLSPDGKLLAAGLYVSKQPVRIFKTADLSEQFAFDAPDKLHGITVNSVSFSPDGKYVASGGWDGKLRLRDPAGKSPSSVLDAYRSRVSAVAFSPTGDFLYTAVDGAGIRLLRMRDRIEIDSLVNRSRDRASMAVSPDGRLLVVTRGGDPVQIWDIHKRSPVMELAGHGPWARSPAFSSSGKLATACGDGCVRIWNPRTCRVERWLEFPDHAWAVAFSPDGRRLAVGYGDGFLDVLDFASEKPIYSLAAHRANVTALVFSHDGETLFSAGADGLCAWSVKAAE